MKRFIVPLDRLGVNLAHYERCKKPNSTEVEIIAAKKIYPDDYE
jgi:hypothetical protein